MRILLLYIPKAKLEQHCVAVCLCVQPSVCVCRALDGDVVAVELLPESQWRGASANLPQADAESATGGEDPEDDAEGGHIAQAGTRI